MGVVMNKQIPIPFEIIIIIIYSTLLLLNILLVVLFGTLPRQLVGRASSVCGGGSLGAIR